MVRWINGVRLKSFYLWVITLQALDLVSTYAAFSTGLAVEKNLILVDASRILGVPIEMGVLLAKIAVVTVFWLAYRQARNSLFDRILMLNIIVFYIVVCFANFYWAIHLGQGKFFQL